MTTEISNLSVTSPSTGTLRFEGTASNANRVEYLIQESPGTTPTEESEPSGIEIVEDGEPFSFDVEGLTPGDKRVWARASDVLSVIVPLVTQETDDPVADITQDVGRETIRVWTGETPVSEPYFDLYFKKNSETAKIRMNRYESRLLAVAPGDEFGFGTDDGRTIHYAADRQIGALDAALPVEGVANCDQAGPPIWEPSEPHITIGSGSSFRILSDGTERVVFISEFDGTTWSPQRWVKLPISGGVTFHATYNEIALANYEGVALSIEAPAGATVGGVSSVMHLPLPEVTGVTHSVENVSELKAAIAAAVAGDEIVLADGIYVMDVNITASSFAANHNVSGRTGMEGITIRSSSDNREACVITGDGAGTNDWFLTHLPDTELSGFRGIKFDFSGTDGAFTIRRGTWAVENCRWTGATGDMFNFIGSIDGDPGFYLDMLRSEADNASADCFNGDRGLRPNYRVRFIDCIGRNAGDSQTAQCLTSHNSLDVEVYGGHYFDAHTNAISFSGSTHDCFMFFAKVSPGSRNGNVLGVYAYGCELLNRDFSLNISGGSTSSGPANPGWMIASTTLAGIREATGGADRIIEGNRLSENAYFPTANSAISFKNNVCEDYQCNFSSNSSPHPVAALHNSWINCSTAFNAVSTTRQKMIIGNVCKNSGTSMSTNATAMGLLIADWNVLDPNISASYVPGANDIVGADADLDANYFPEIAGNCDGTGDPNATDWIGGTDYQGFTLRLASAIIDRGARCRPRVIENAELLPDAWT